MKGSSVAFASKGMVSRPDDSYIKPKKTQNRNRTKNRQENLRRSG